MKRRCSERCGKCTEFKKNNCKDCNSVIYGTTSLTLGNCLITGRLRNELNACDLTDKELGIVETMNKFNEQKEDLKQTIENILNSLLHDFYVKNGIITGDITPLQSEEWEVLRDKYAELFIELAVYNTPHHLNQD